MRQNLSDFDHRGQLAAVIGAGPAGLYAAQYLARQGVQVVLFNRDIKPGGLAEYGIFPDKHKMRRGLHTQFQRILEMPEVHYVGNVVIGQNGDIKLDQLRQAGFQALVITTGAQQQNWLGLPGEDLAGVYPANKIVYHYNRLPGYGDWQPEFGKNIAVIGAGNVMLDIVHYLKKENQPRTLTAYARRGPTEVKFDRETLAPVAHCLDLPEIRIAVDEALEAVNGVGKDVDAFYSLLDQAQQKAGGCEGGLHFRIRFLCSPRRLIGDANGRVKAVVFEKNRLVRDGDRISALGTGEVETLPADTVIYSIGSRVDDGFGLPVGHGNYLTTPEPRFPIDGISYEVYNPELCARCEDIFVGGWARLASEGIVGLARKDAERCARAVLAYLETLPLQMGLDAGEAIKRLPPVDKKLIVLDDLRKLEEVEQRIAVEKGLPEYKFGSWEEMLEAIKET